MLNLSINDIVTQNKDSLVLSQCSIDGDKEKESTTTQNFSQDQPLEEELKPRKTLDKKIRVLDSKIRDKNRINMVRKVNQDFIKHVDEIKEAIKNLKTSMDKKLEEDNMQKGMAFLIILNLVLLLRINTRKQTMFNHIET
jgi:nitrogen fixation/metabolism regulation signal transduction histidine kinase